MPSVPLPKFHECLSTTTEEYVVPPANSIRVCIATTKFNTYVSIEEMKQNGEDSVWVHRKNSSVGFGGSLGAARDYAERLWNKLQTDASALTP